MYRFSLRLKFIVVIVLLVGIFATSFAFVLLNRNIDTLRSNLTTEVQAFASLATQPVGDSYVTYKDTGQVRVDVQVKRYTDLDKNIDNVTIVDTEGTALYTLDGDKGKNISKAQAESLETFTKFDESGTPIQIIYPYLDSFGAHHYGVVYDISPDSINQAVSEARISGAVSSIAILVLAGVATFLLINQLFLQPVRKLRESAIAISLGKLNQPIAMARNDEIGDLAKAVNTMANSLKADIRKLKEADDLKTEFLLITSHHIRTPLTLMSGYLESLLSMPIDKPVLNSLEIIKSQNDKLHMIAEQMLMISSIEAGHTIVTKDHNPVEPLLTQLAGDYKLKATQKKLQFMSQVPASNTVLAFSQYHLKSAISNILDNALKFSKPGGTIRLKGFAEASNYVIEVSDQGVGIADSELQRLFTKFHRGTSIMVFDYEGMGLGLYITKLIVEQLQGTIDVKSVPDQGTTVTIRIPLLTEPPATPLNAPAQK